MMSRLSSLVVCLVTAVRLSLAAAEVQPDLTKLHPITPFAALIEAARSRKIRADGIDPPGEADILNPGDSATALFTLFEKGGRKTQWLLLIEAAAPKVEEKTRAAGAPVVLYAGAGEKLEFAHKLAPATLRLVGPVMEVQGKSKSAKIQDDTARIVLDKGFLGIGHDEAAAAICRIMQNQLHGGFQVRGRPFTDAEVAEGRKQMAALKSTVREQRAFIGSSMALESYFDLVQQTPGLDDVFMKIVKVPSVWSVVWHLGVKISIDLLRKDVAPQDALTWNLPAGTPCHRLPLVFRVNDQPALILTLVVVPPRPPMLSCGGIVGLLAEKPGDKDTYLTLQLISAHCAKVAPGEHAASGTK